MGKKKTGKRYAKRRYTTVGYQDWTCWHEHRTIETAHKCRAKYRRKHGWTDREIVAIEPGVPIWRYDEQDFGVPLTKREQALVDYYNERAAPPKPEPERAEPMWERANGEWVGVDPDGWRVR